MILTTELHEALNRREWRKMIESARRVTIHESELLPDRNQVLAIDVDAASMCPLDLIPIEQRGFVRIIVAPEHAELVRSTVDGIRANRVLNLFFQRLTHD